MNELGLIGIFYKDEMSGQYIHTGETGRRVQTEGLIIPCNNTLICCLRACRVHLAAVV